MQPAPPQNLGQALRAIRAEREAAVNKSRRAGGRTSPNHDDTRAGLKAGKALAVGWGFSTEEGYPTQLAHRAAKAPSTPFTADRAEQDAVTAALPDAEQVRRLSAAISEPDLLSKAERKEADATRAVHMANLGEAAALAGMDLDRLIELADAQLDLADEARAAKAARAARPYMDRKAA